MNEEPLESLWVKIKKYTCMNDIVDGICFDLPDQKLNEAFQRQLESVTFSGPGPHRRLQRPQYLWRDTTAGHKQSRKH